MFKAANPYDEIVTKATAETLTSENWEVNLEVCDKVSNEGETGARNCIAALQKRLVHRNANVQLYSLTLADALAKNSGITAHRELASRNFTQSIARIVADRNTHDSVRRRATGILDEWARDFKDDDGSLGLVKETLDQLRQQGFQIGQAPPAEPAEPSSEQLRREDEELRRVLELSMQDQGGRGANSASAAIPGPSSSAATAARPGAAANALVDKSLPDPNAQPAQSQAVPSQPQPASSPQNQPPHRVRALYDFTPSEVGELPFQKGDIIRVLDSVYEHWWRGELRGEAGIFPVNYVEILPDPSPDEIRREAEQEARIFQQAGNIDRLLSRLRALEAEGGGANLAEDEELQELYQSSLAMRPRIVRLIDRYSSKVSELRSLNEKFVRARGTFDSMMERSMAAHQPGQSHAAYMGARPEYGQAHVASSAPPQQRHQQFQQQQPQWQGSATGAAAAASNGYDYSQQQQANPNPYSTDQRQDQWQQPQQQQQQYHQQQQPQQGYAGYSQQDDPSQYHQQQQHQQQPSAPQGLQQPPAGYGHHHATSEEEKNRLYEQARREAEAYHAAYGQQAYPNGAGGSQAAQ
ncbi:unnamed protein product [Jaminaea pallidilutea]